MLGEFFDKPQAIDRVLGRVMKDMELDEATGKQIEAGSLG
jgi:hypothetical protein